MMTATSPCIRCQIPVENPVSLANVSVGGQDRTGPVCEECQALVMTNPIEFWGGFPEFNRAPRPDSLGPLGRYYPPPHVWVSFAVWCAMVFLAGMTVGMLIAR